ncbi:hypothetical protein GCM10027030_16940 [Luteococcus sediminum]
MEAAARLARVTQQQWPGSPWGPRQSSGWQQTPFGQVQYSRGPVPRGQVVFGRPRRRRSLLGTLVRAMFLLAVMGFLGLLALGWLLGQVVQTVPSTVPDPQTRVTAAPQDPATRAPAPQTTPAPPGEYQNDDYQVPPVAQNPPGLPQPETYEEASQLLQANPLYSTSVPRPVRCEMADIDIERASRRELSAHLNEMMGCLMRVWEGPLDQAGFTAVRPSVTVYSSSVTTKCGKLPRRNAVYCGADQQVYFATDLPQVVPARLRDSRFITEAVVAHEFGHAVQARSAVLASELAWEERSSKSVGLEYSRRLEVQADCFAGQFLGSVQQSTRMTDQELDNVGRLFYSIGDDVLTGRRGYEGNHGSGQSRLEWTRKGLESTSVGACNSFAAPSSQVR